MHAQYAGAMVVGVGDGDNDGSVLVTPLASSFTSVGAIGATLTLTATAAGEDSGDGDPAVVLDSSSARGFARFGTSVVLADVTGDGFAEVVVGAPGDKGSFVAQGGHAADWTYGGAVVFVGECETHHWLL